MSILTAQVKHQQEVSVIQLAGYLSSEAANTAVAAFQQMAEARKVLLVFQEFEAGMNSVATAAMESCLA